MSIEKPELPEGYKWGDVTTRIVSGSSNLLVKIRIEYSYPIEDGYIITDAREFNTCAHNRYTDTLLKDQLDMISDTCWARHNIENLLKE